MTILDYADLVQAYLDSERQYRDDLHPHTLTEVQRLRREVEAATARIRQGVSQADLFERANRISQEAQRVVDAVWNEDSTDAEILAAVQRLEDLRKEDPS